MLCMFMQPYVSTISILEYVQHIISKSVLVLEDKPERSHLAVHHLTLEHSA